MKTAITKTTLDAQRKAYLDLQAHVDSLRSQYRKDRDEMRTEEEEILQRMFMTIHRLQDLLGRFPTSAEVAQAMQGEMSRREVLGQLLVGANCHYNGTGRTHGATHATTQAEKGKLHHEYRRTTRKFAEVTEQGELVQGGKTFTKEECLMAFGYSEKR